ncbi:uncharacterized protein LOC144115631 isoform X2 [Amblyomma americanum]
MSPLSRFGAVLVCACSAYIAEHNNINRTMAATCSWFSGHGKSKKTGVSAFKVEKAMYDTVKRIPIDAVFHKRTAIPIWSTEAVVLCSSSGNCSGGDNGSGPFLLCKQRLSFRRFAHHQYCSLYVPCQIHRRMPQKRRDTGRSIVATQLESSCYQGNSTYSTLPEKMHAMMLGASILTILPILSTNDAKDAFVQISKS